MKKLLSTLALVFLPLVAEAQSISFQPGDFGYFGNARYDATTSEVVLTDDATGQRGYITSPKKICAKAYSVDFDVFPGNLPASLSGGAGVVFYEQRADDPSKWLQVLGFNIQDRQFASTWYNSVELMRFNDVANTTTQLKAPFSLTGNGWLHVTWIKNKENVTAIISGAAGIMSLSQKRTFEPGVPVVHQLLGWTGVAHNKQAIKNFSINISEPDTCPGMEMLDLTATRTVIEQSCGGEFCPVKESMVSCASKLLESMKAAGNITESVEQSVLDECSVKDSYCQASKECDAKLQEAFNNGVQSVDVESIKAAAFQSGVDSINVSEIRRIAFQEGVDSVDANAAWEDGYAKGASSCVVEDSKVSICHKGNVISVSVNALSAHYSHGDTLGSCARSTKKRK